MRINNLKQIWLVTIVLLSGALVSMYYTEKHMRDSLQGNLVFADEKGDLPEFAKIEVETSLKKVTIQKDENLWRIAETDNYYASFSKVQMLLDNIAEARLGKEILSLPPEIIWKTVRLFDPQDQEINAIKVGKSTNHNVYYIRYLDDPKIYLSTWTADLPDNIYSWVRQPLLSIVSQEIGRIEKGKKAIIRRDESSAYYNEQNKRPYLYQDYLKIFEILKDLHYEKVLSSQEFAPEAYPHRQTINLTSFSGLITQISVYTNDKDYWLQINLSANRLPREEVIQYIAQNEFLYKDWWFKIDSDEGSGLFNFRF